MTKHAKLLTVLLGTLLAAACADPGPTLSVSDVQVVAPAPGRSATVAYMSVRNSGSEETTLLRVTSPDYESAELHETRIEDNVARMNALKKVVIAAGASARFEPGGKHIMLMQPVRAFPPGTMVSLTLHFAADSELVVEAPIATSINVE